MTTVAEGGAVTSRAARYHGVGDIRIENVRVPHPGSDEVLIEVAFCGICGSDLHEYFSAQTVTPIGNHPLTGQSLPVVLGHEFSGIVVERGNSVTDIAVGDRVAVRPTYSCGSCESCTRGFPNICAQMAFHGLSGSGGGLSTFTTVRASMAFVLPANVTLEQGALVEPMAVAYHGVARVVDENSKLAFVGGAGPIGLGALFALRACGIENALVSDPSPARRAVAAGFGATTFDPTTTSLTEVLAGRNLDIAVEAAGVGAVVASAIEALGPRGRLVLLGLHEKPMSFDPTNLLYREVSVFGSSTYNDDDYRAVIAAMSAGSYDPAGWVEIRPMNSLLQTFEELRDGGPSKVLIDLHQP